jgi:septation ring formation regulator EzrA
MKKEDLILELLRELKTDMNSRFEQIDKRFEQVDKRFEQIDKRFEQIEKRLDRIEDNQNREQTRLNQVYESRDKVKITFGWQWGMISVFIAVGAAAIVKILS